MVNRAAMALRGVAVAILGAFLAVASPSFAQGGNAYGSIITIPVVVETPS